MSERSKRPLVFVIISFEEKYEPIFTLIQAICGVNGLDAVRADESKTVIRKIHPEIFSKLFNADIIIADITSYSPNVFYEIGWAHALGKPTLLIAENGSKIPFDINDYPVFRYDSRLPYRVLRSQFEKEILKYVSISDRHLNLQQPLIDILVSVSDTASRNDLFASLLKWTINKFASESKRWMGGSIHVGSTETLEKGIEVFKLLRKGGFATYLVPLNSFWTTDSKYLEECRSAARKGVSIQRVFVLPNHVALFSESLREHIKRDEAAGIQTFVTFSDSIPDRDALQDFGIWDDELLCLIETRTTPTGTNIVKGGVFSHSEVDLEKARSWKNSIMSVAVPSTQLLEEVDTLPELTKLLFSSADKMEEYSSRYCKGSYLTKKGEKCDWYHSSWQYLRILDMVSCPQWHDSFYRLSFLKAISSSARDVLISGLADYSIIYQLAQSIPKELLQKIVITVIDSCATPLQITRWFNNWFEERNGFRLNLRYVQRDALQTHFESNTFDVIATDAFITRFNFDLQKELLGEWRRILKQNGVIITTARLSKTNQLQEVKAAPNDVIDYKNVALRNLKKKELFRASAPKILSFSELYATHITSFPLPSEQYIVELFQGFSVDIGQNMTKGELKGTTEYAQIFATKL